MNIVIRHAEPSDYESLWRLFSDPKVVRGTMQLPYPSAEHWRKRLAEPSQGLFRLVACVEDEVVASLGLRTFPDRPRRHHVGVIGMAVRDDWHGKGIGTALMQAAVDLADRWLNLTRLELTVFTDNAAAIGVYQKFGFATEGTLVDYVFRDGRYVDCLTMARVRE